MKSISEHDFERIGTHCGGSGVFDSFYRCRKCKRCKVVADLSAGQTVDPVHYGFYFVAGPDCDGKVVE